MANNPLAVNQTTVLSGQVGDVTSGVSLVEYYVGSVDPGAGNGVAMTVASGVASASVGAYATAGMHTYNVRAQDVAGNWSPLLTINLDVYNPADGYVAGHGFVTPVGATSDPGDTLPSVSGNNVKATLDLTVRYETVNSTTPTGNSLFTWWSGNCKKAGNTCFVADATSLVWLIVPGDGTATFQGSASLSLNGQTQGSNYPMRVRVVDGGLVQPDHYLLQIYAVGANPDVAAPIYQASGDLTGGNVTLHQ